MIAVDTSALLAILLGEDDAGSCIAVLSKPSERFIISAGTLTEALIVAQGRGVRREMNALIEGLAMEVAPVTEATAARVADIYKRFGKGHHPARLNFADCFAYDVATAHGCPLLFVGEDFAQTDIKSARDRPEGFQEVAGDLFGRDEESKQIERLFVGIMLTPDAARSAAGVLGAVREAERLRGADIREDRMHVTLVHIGDYLGSIPESIKREAGQALTGIEAPAFEAVFDRVGSFAGAPGKHPFVLLSDKPDAMAAFREQVWNALLRAGVNTLSRQVFTPHVTLSYAETQKAVMLIDPIRWRVDEVLLIHSEAGRSTYHTLGRFPLAS